MRFSFACATACVFAVAALAVPVEVEKKVVVVRAEVCPAPAPTTTTAPAPAPEVSSAPENQAPPPSESPAAPAAPSVSNAPEPQTTTVSNDNKQCSAGTSVHCCDTVDSTDNSSVLNQLTAAGIDHQTAQQKGQVGLTCKLTPFSSWWLDINITFHRHSHHNLPR